MSFCLHRAAGTRERSEESLLLSGSLPAKVEMLTALRRMCHFVQHDTPFRDLLIIITVKLDT